MSLSRFLQGEASSQAEGNDPGTLGASEATSKGMAAAGIESEEGTARR